MAAPTSLTAPVALQRGVEHVAQPVQDDGLLGLAQHMVVDTLVVGRAACHAGQRAAGHHDEPAAQLLDGVHLLVVGAQHVVHALRVVGRQLVGAAAAGDERTALVTRGVQAARDEFQRGGPVQPHATLRRVHGLGHAQAQAPQALAVADGGVPVHGALQPGVDGGACIGHHVRGRIRDARQRRAHARGCKGARPLQRVRRHAAVVGDQLDLHGHAHRSSAGTSTQRRSFQLCSAASTSCTPLAPSGSVHA
jgi:hypothetical protein